MIGKCCKKMKNISNVLFLLVMSLLPWAYFIFTPYGFPWFIIPCGILLSLKLVKVARNNKEKLQDKFRLTVHSIFYVIFNAIFIISNLYLGGFPVALLIFNTWSLFFAIHAIRVFKKDSKYNSKFFTHFLVYNSVGFTLFIIYCYGFCITETVKSHNRGVANEKHIICPKNPVFGLLFVGLPMAIWSIILFLHLLVTKKRKFSFCGITVITEKNNELVEDDIQKEDDIPKEEEFEIVEQPALLSEEEIINISGKEFIRNNEI